MQGLQNRLKQWIYTCRSLWIVGRRDSTMFGVVDDTTTTKFTNRACAVHCNSLPVVVDKAVVMVLEFPNVYKLTTISVYVHQRVREGGREYNQHILHRTGYIEIDKLIN